MLPLATFWQLVDESVVHLLSQDGSTPAQEDEAFATLSERRRNEAHRRYHYVHAAVKSGRHPFAGLNLKIAIDEAYTVEEEEWRDIHCPSLPIPGGISATLWQHWIRPCKSNK
jgi:hypothetical protein